MRAGSQLRPREALLGNADLPMGMVDLVLPFGDPGHMLGHLGINVPDLGTAREYYAHLMPLLGFEIFLDREDELAYMPAEGKRGTYLFFYPATDAEPYSRHRPGLQHLAFMVPTREAVAIVWKRALELGSVDVHAPQHWPQYPPPYFSAFWLDPFGFMVEAVCHHDR